MKKLLGSWRDWQTRTATATAALLSTEAQQQFPDCARTEYRACCNASLF